jgi:hypothetical protein
VLLKNIILSGAASAVLLGAAIAAMTTSTPVEKQTCHKPSAVAMSDCCGGGVGCGDCCTDGKCGECCGDNCQNCCGDNCAGMQEPMAQTAALNHGASAECCTAGNCGECCGDNCQNCCGDSCGMTADEPVVPAQETEKTCCPGG